jgi:hypothetical protein
MPVSNLRASADSFGVSFFGTPFGTAKPNITLLRAPAFESFMGAVKLKREAVTLGDGRTLEPGAMVRVTSARYSKEPGRFMGSEKNRLVVSVQCGRFSRTYLRVAKSEVEREKTP